MIKIEEIFNQLDKAAEEYIFPMLDNGYYYHGDQKMTLFRDQKRWAILIEIFALHNHEYNTDSFTTITSAYGNCLLERDKNDDFNFFVNDVDKETFLYDEENYVPYLDSSVQYIKFRDTLIPLHLDNDLLKSKGIVPEFPDRITPWEVMRSLIPEYSHHIWLTKDEIAKIIPHDIPIFLQLDQWLHPDLADNQKPSEMESFIQLAQALVSGNKEIYNPSTAPNTHWKNWPEGGTL